MTAAGHPVWCDLQHGDAWPVHGAFLGDVETGKNSGISVELHRYSDDRAAVVSMTIADGNDDTLMDLTGEQARDLARFLAAAADILEAADAAPYRRVLDAAQRWEARP